MNQQALSAFIWSVADLLRGDYRQSEYGRVILPLTVLRRLDCVLEPTKTAVLAELKTKKKQGVNPEPFLLRKAGQSFFNTSPLDMKKLMGAPDDIRQNLESYIAAFSPAVRDIFEKFEFHTHIDRLAKAKLLYQVVEKFAQVDLHPDKADNHQMGLVFEELIRKFAELSNETAGEHFTPREVIRLMVNLLFVEDDEVLSRLGVVRTIYDPTAGTGGMLSIAEEYLAEHNPGARLSVFGQELNPESYAICKADMLIKGQDVSKIVFGNTLSDDGHPNDRFDYMLSNPPFGVEWKKVEKEVRREHEQKGFNGRFGPGLPRVSDGSMLFLLHLIAKMRPAKDGGSRFGIVLNGSPLFTGGAGSGESEIRRYVLENDLLEAIIGLPTDMFYNTGISTYVWIVSNRKPAHRKGKVQLIDASEMWQKMRKSLGSKRKELSEEHITEITRLFGQFVEAEREGKPISRIFDNADFGYYTITVERPEQDAMGKVVIGTKGKQKGKPQPDTKLRDTENVPLNRSQPGVRYPGQARFDELLR
jgi:type I restriction enzyme M protein